MKIVNTGELEENGWQSPMGAFRGSSKDVSIALGRDPRSTDLMKRHPFDVEILRIPPGATPYPYHSHSAQWEFYHVIAGSGIVRHDTGEEPIRAGDAFIFKPGEAHQIRNTGEQDMIVHVVADNPIGECFHYPDSGKWGVPIPDRRFMRADPAGYYDGEE